MTTNIFSLLKTKKLHEQHNIYKALLTRNLKASLGLHTQLVSKTLRTKIMVNFYHFLESSYWCLHSKSQAPKKVIIFSYKLQQNVEQSSLQGYED